MDLKYYIEATYDTGIVIGLIREIDKSAKGPKGNAEITDIVNKYCDTGDKKVYLAWDKKSKKSVTEINHIEPVKGKHAFIITLMGKGSRESLEHEVIHLLDYLRSPQRGNVKKSYIKVMEKEKPDAKDIIPYLNNTEEFNQFINEIKISYETNKRFRRRIQKASSYEELNDVIFKHGHIPELNDVAFKKKFLRRMYREGMISPEQNIDKK